MQRLRSGILELRTPEGIVFSLLLASPISRFLAWTLDCACIVTASAVLRKLLSGIGAVDAGIARASLAIGYFAISIGYGIACEWFWRGQTIGKRVLSLRVMDEEGLHLQFSQVVVRNLLRFVDALPGLYLVGGAVCVLSRKAQRLGDLAASTIVVRQPRVTQPDVAQLFAGKYNSLLDYPYLAARLRQRVSPATAAVALEALLRRDSLDPEARLELFAEIAQHFRSLIQFPEEAIEQVSDEQYVRNVAEVLYSRRVESAALASPG